MKFPWFNSVDEKMAQEEFPGNFDQELTKAFVTFQERINEVMRLGDEVTHKDRLEMRRDPTLRFASLLKKFAILGRGWEIQQKDADEDVTEFVNNVLINNFKGSFLDKLRQMLSALDHGVSVTEKNWTILEDGSICLCDMKTREKELDTFRVKKDVHGNIRSVEQEGVENPIPLEKLIIFTYLGEGDQLTGNSDFEAAWDAWFRKRTIREFWSAYLELRSKINVIAKFTGQDLSSKLAKKIWDMLKHMQLGGRMILPDGVETDVVQMGQQDANLFFKAMKYYDGQLFKAILTPQLIGEAGTEQSSAGSYALGRSHFDIFIMILNYVRTDLEEIVNQEIIQPLVDFNFDVDVYPQFTIRFFEQTDKESLAELVNGLIEHQVVKPDERWIRSFLGVPDPAKSIELPGIDDLPDSEVAGIENLSDDIMECYEEIKQFMEEKDHE